MKNSYQGYEVEKHRAIMTGKMYLQITLSCLFFQLIIFVLLATCHLTVRGKLIEAVPQLHRQLIWKWPLAHLTQSFPRRPFFHLTAKDRLRSWPHDPDGTVTVSAAELNRSIDYGRVLQAFALPFKLSFLSWLVWPLSLKYFRRATARIKDSQHIRGGRLITEEEIAGSNGTGILPIGKIVISEELSRRHLLIAGQTGSGKSTILFQHLDAIQRAGRRAVVNDFKGELVERFYRPDRDLILNPFDERGLGWTLFNELETKSDLAAVTGSLIPPSKGEDRFWSAAAQDVLRGVLAYCYESGKRNNAALWKALTSPLADIRDMCQGTESGHAGCTYIQDASSKQALGVIAVLMSYVSWLEFAVDGPFSLRKWTRENRDCTIFITNSEEVTNIMRPYLSLFADLAGKRLLTLPEIRDPRESIYLILDEMANMQRLPSVKRLLTAGRSKGVVVEIGIPDFSSIVSIYGHDDAHTIVNSCGSKFVLNLGDPDAAKYFSQLAGEEEYWESSTFYSISQNDNKGGENHNRQIKKREVILPAQIERLPVGQGYVMLPGGNPALVRIPWTAANQKVPQNRPFTLRSGLCLTELEAKNDEVAALVQHVTEASTSNELKVVEDLFRLSRSGIKPEEILGIGEDTEINEGNDLSK